MDPQTHDLVDFMLAVTQDMAHEYERIQKRSAEDPGTAGDQGEENWAALFREWLSPTYQIVTKGRILSDRGAASPQIDVLVLHSSYPRSLLDKKLYLAGGVAAAFECKVTLKAEHIYSAMENATYIKRLLHPRSGSLYRELHSPLIYGLLAHAHTWKGRDSMPSANIDKHLHEADLKFVQHPSEMLDLVCVANLATWVSWKIIGSTFDPSIFVSTIYMRHADIADEPSAPVTPIGDMLSRLWRKLAWEDPAIRNLAQYFFEVPDLEGRQGVGAARSWGSSVFSQPIIEQLVAGLPKPEKAWDEWNANFEFFAPFY